MILVHSIYLIPKGQTELLAIQLYVWDKVVGTHGYWITGNNKVVLSSSGYSDYKAIMGNQPAIRKFFDGLQKVEQLKLT